MANARFFGDYKPTTKQLDFAEELVSQLKGLGHDDVDHYAEKVHNIDSGKELSALLDDMITARDELREQKRDQRYKGKNYRGKQW